MKRAPIWAALLLASLAVVACGDDDDEGAGGTERATSPAVSEAAAVFDCEADYPGTEPDTAAFPVEVRDTADNALTFEEPPSAIVSLSAAHVEILYAIGAGDQLIAGDMFSDCPLAAQDLEQLDSFAPSVEAITALEPDLVVLGFENPDLQNALSGVGVTSLLLEAPPEVGGILDQIALLGRVTGHQDEARDLSGAMTGRIEEIKDSVPAGEAPSVYHEVDNTFFSAGEGSFVDDLYDILGAKNIADATGQAFPQLTQEAIIAAEPEVIILADENEGESAETVKARPGWEAIPAVQNDRIYVVDPDIVGRPGPRVVEALELLAEHLYEGQ